MAAVFCSAVVRFASFVPLVIVGFSGRGTYGDVKDLDALGIYDVIPSGQTFLSGLQMYSTWGIFAFARNIFAIFFSYLEYGKARGWLRCVPATIDSIVGISLLVCVVKQAQFLPRTYGSCDDATNWRNGTDGRNFFVVANQTTPGSYADPGDICHSMVELWATALPIGILYCLLGFINLFVGLTQVCSRRDRDDNQSTCTPGLVVFMAFLIGPVFWILDHPMAASRFAFRYMCKALAARRKNRGDAKSFHQQQQGPGKDPAEKQPDMDTVTEHHPVPMLPYELLLQVAGHLHFVDLISASRSSKRLRTGLFGFSGPDRSKLQDLRRFTCQGLKKRKCELCGMQTCWNCDTQFTFRPSPAFQHLRNCRPQCSKCFYKTHCRWGTPQGLRLAKHGKACELRGVRERKRRSDVEMASGFYVARTVTLCRLCAEMTSVKRTRAFEAKDERELEKRGMGPLACSKCRKMISAGGMRWWICGTCEAECSSDMHPTWGDERASSTQH